MIEASLTSKSLTKARKQVRNAFRKKSLRWRQSTAKKVDRRFKRAARDTARELSPKLARYTGLSVPQAKRRVRPDRTRTRIPRHDPAKGQGTVRKNLRGNLAVRGEFMRTDVFTRGRGQGVHFGRLKIREPNQRERGRGQRGLYIRGKFYKGAFIHPKSRSRKKELRRVLVRNSRGLRPLTDRRRIRRGYRRYGPAILRRQSRRLAVDIVKIIKRA